MVKKFPKQMKAIFVIVILIFLYQNIRTHLKNPISAAMTRLSAASRSSLLTIAKLFLVRLHGFRSKIPHFAAKAIFEMGSNQFSREYRAGFLFGAYVPVSLNRGRGS